MSDGTTTLTARLIDSCSQFANRHGLYLGRRSTALHVALYRRTHGRLGARMPAHPEARILLLDHTGARTGHRRTSPLIYYADGDTLAIVASKAGLPHHPAWFHNLKAHPDTTIQLGPTTLPVHARVATPEERTLLWPHLVAIFPSYAAYEQTTTRTIPIVLLTPRL
ncbi:nitroreductase family deazaflavin-dependent oxidoreductase [Nocardia sp. AG03]|uniref:nitroreductase family deazaflavin-dependent oxidoreductase n=1 Tax=Nocardia sp. AG03 TaxID=3025312 RepID=UPI002418A6EC|nr:nitroreductase family deazaflavin-dependent oxidoreductase [Nocardia sp. AG03]